MDLGEPRALVAARAVEGLAEVERQLGTEPLHVRAPELGHRIRVGGQLAQEPVDQGREPRLASELVVERSAVELRSRARDGEPDQDDERRDPCRSNATMNRHQKLPWSER